MTPKQIQELKNSYWSNKLQNVAREAREAKAVMFGENIESLFTHYRISEGEAELTRRIELSKPANQEDFETVINYISNYFDLDSVDLQMSDSVLNWLSNNDLEGLFTDTVLPTMIASPNSYLVLIPKERGGLLDMSIEVIDLERIIYTDNDTFIFYTQDVDVSSINSKYLYVNKPIDGDYIVLNKEGGFLYNSEGDLITEIMYPNEVTSYWFKLGGLKRINHRGFYNSYFKGSIDKSIIATRIFSDKEIIRMRVGNPITMMKKLPCPECEGSGCNSCHSTGTVELKPSIGSVFYFNEFDLNKGDKTSLDNIIKYIQPPLDSVKVQREEYELHSQEVKEGLNNFYYKHSQSGVAKEIDREDKVASTEVILLRLFTLAESVLNAYSEIVTIEKIPVTIVVPNELVTDGEIPTSKLGLSASELSTKTLQYYTNKYKDDPVSLRLYKYAVTHDFLFPYTAEEKKSLGTQQQVDYSNQLSLAILKVRDKYKDRVRQATDKTITKWLSEFIESNQTDINVN